MSSGSRDATPEHEGPGPVPGGGWPQARDAAEREAARLRWELARLRSRRSVQAALLLGRADDVRGHGPGDVVATLRGRRVVEDLDVIEPATVRRRCPYPHLDVVHLSTSPPFAAAAPHRRVTPDDAATLPRQPPDLLLLDDLAGLARWPEPARASLRAALGACGAVVALVDGPQQAAEAAHWPADLVLLGPGATPPPGAASLPLLPGVDPGTDNPVGWRREPARPAVVLGEDGDGTGLAAVGSPADATDAGAVVVRSAAGTREIAHLLALLARGIPVVVPDEARLPAELEALVVRAAANEVTATARELGGDVAARERHSVRVRRRVLREHDQRARLEQVLAELGVTRRRPERISVLLATRRPEQVDEAVAQVAAQDHPDVELIAALHGEGFDGDTERRVSSAFDGPCEVVRVHGNEPLGEVLNAALDRATGTLIAKMDDDDLYGPGHLSDLVVALGYSGADVVGRRANEVYLADQDVTLVQDLDRQERWAHQLPGPTLLLPADVLRAVRFRRVPRAVDTHLLRSVFAAGGSAYATHRFGFLRRRNAQGHTYAVDTQPGAGGRRSGLDRSVLDV